VADRIMEALEAHEELALTPISQVVGRNVGRKRLGQALDLLKRAGLVGTAGALDRPPGLGLRRAGQPRC
jgi:hypothetical protein